MKEAITLCIAWLRLDATTVWTAPSTYSPASLGDRAVAIKALHTNGAIFPYLFAVYSLPPVLSTITIQTDWQTKQPCSCHRQHAANTIPPLAELLQSQWQYSLCQSSRADPVDWGCGGGKDKTCSWSQSLKRINWEIMQEQFKALHVGWKPAYVFNESKKLFSNSSSPAMGSL